jgi:hypothetical protein
MTEAGAPRRPPAEEPVLEPKRLATDGVAVSLHDWNDCVCKSWGYRRNRRKIYGKEDRDETPSVPRRNYIQ